MTALAVFEVADVLVERVRRSYANDVALVCCYGSYARGTATARSDLDLFFIPDTERGRDAALTVLVGGVTFDFWAIDWEWLERSARLEERGSPIVAEAQIMYAKSDQDRERFEDLRRSLATVATAGDPLRYAELAQHRLRRADTPLRRLQQASAAADDVECRRSAVDVVSIVCGVVAVVNRTFLRSSGAEQINELRGLTLTSPTLVADLSEALNADEPTDIDRACERAVNATAELVTERLRQLRPPPVLKSSAVGFFEELSGLLEKLRFACETSDHHTALFTAVTVEREIDHLLGSSDRPDLVPLARPAGLLALAVETDRLEQWLRRRLAAADVHIREFASADGLRNYVAQLDRDS